MASVSIRVDTRGPVFDNRAQRALDEYLDEAAYAIASQGSADVHYLLDRSLKHPTPYYETQITVERVPTGATVHDRGVIYGPWLEGIGSRNYPVTRFRGYGTFRRAARELQAKAQQIAESVLREYLRRMQ